MNGMLDEQLDLAPVQGLSRLTWYWLPVILYAGLIFWLSSLSHPEELAPPLLKQLSDKSLHAIEYAVLAVLCYRAFRYAAGSWAARYALMLAIVLATAYGATDEWHQAFVPLRTPDGWDLLTDLAGATAGASAWQWINEWYGRLTF